MLLISTCVFSFQFLIAIGSFFLKTNKQTSNSEHEASDKNVVKWRMFAASNMT